MISFLEREDSRTPAVVVAYMPLVFRYRRVKRKHHLKGHCLIQAPIRQQPLTKQIIHIHTPTIHHSFVCVSKWVQSSQRTTDVGITTGTETFPVVRLHRQTTPPPNPKAESARQGNNQREVLDDADERWCRGGKAREPKKRRIRFRRRSCYVQGISRSRPTPAGKASKQAIGMSYKHSRDVGVLRCGGRIIESRTINRGKKSEIRKHRVVVTS